MSPIYTRSLEGTLLEPCPASILLTPAPGKAPERYRVCSLIQGQCRAKAELQAPQTELGNLPDVLLRRSRAVHTAAVTTAIPLLLIWIREATWG